MYLGIWNIDDNLVISSNTFSASTGAAYAATSITYRIYEGDTTTEIVSDTSMIAFDSVTGFYLNKIQLTAAAGFEVGKCYTVLIQATVDGVSANTTHSFQIDTAPPTASDIATAVWAAGTRTLSSFGSLASDTATAVWGAGTRSLTTFGTLVSDVATAVWASTSTVLKKILAYCAGNGTRSTGVGTTEYVYKDTDGTTPVMTHTYDGTDRTVS